MRATWVLWSILLAFFSLTGQAQDIGFRKNTIYLDGEPYGYLVKEGSAWAKEYSLQNLKKQELVSIKPVSKKIADGYDLIYYEVNFKSLKLSTELQDDDKLARLLAYEFARFQILKGDTLDRDAVLKFLEKYPAKRFSSQNFIAQ